jgi:hypothetical protein
MLDRQVGGLLAFENSAGVDADQTVRVHKTGSVAHQSAGQDETTHERYHRNRTTRCQCSDLLAPAREERIAADEECTCAHLGHSRKDRIEVAFGAGAQRMQLQSKLGGGFLQVSRLRLGIGIGRVDKQGNDIVAGSTSCASSNRFGATSSNNRVTPVRLPPGLFRLATSPNAVGSVPTENTIGIVAVAAFAASTDGVPLAETMTATCQ